MDEEVEQLRGRVRELEQQLEAALAALAGMVREHCPARWMVHHGHELANQEAFMVLERAGWMLSDVNLDVFWLLTAAEREVREHDG